MDHDVSLESAEAADPLLDESSTGHQTDDDILVKIPQEAYQRNEPGSWKAAGIVLAFNYLQMMTLNSLSTNLISYLKTAFHGDNASNAAKVTTWSGTCYFTPLFAALIADTYWGCYKTIIISGSIYIIGMVAITIFSFAESLSPSLSIIGSSCQPANGAWEIAFFSGLYMVAFGSGGIMSVLLPFGANQFDEGFQIEREKKASFFTWFYFCSALGGLTSGTLIVWIQENVDWSLAFGITTAALSLGFGLIIFRTPYYRLRRPTGSPLMSILQVLVASFRKMGLEVPADDSLLYEVNDMDLHNLGQQQLAHTREFRFLNKAAIISKSDLQNGEPRVSWRLCTRTQVEELKILARLFPIWFTGAISSTSLTQIYTTFVEQGSVMQTKIGSFSIPPASLSSTLLIFSFLWVIIYNRIISPMSRRYFGKGDGNSLLQKLGLGHFLNILAMAIAASVETRRLENINAGKITNIGWQLPQYFLMSGSQFFLSVNNFMFFYEQAPDSMKSICTALVFLCISIGSYLSSLIVNLISFLTTMDGKQGWLPDDLNKGHLDFFFWSLACLCTFNFVAYIFAATVYTPKKVASQSSSQ